MRARQPTEVASQICSLPRLTGSPARWRTRPLTPDDLPLGQGGVIHGNPPWSPPPLASHPTRSSGTRGLVGGLSPGRSVALGRRCWLTPSGCWLAFGSSADAPVAPIGHARCRSAGGLTADFFHSMGRSTGRSSTQGGLVRRLRFLGWAGRAREPLKAHSLALAGSGRSSHLPSATTVALPPGRSAVVSPMRTTATSGAPHPPFDGADGLSQSHMLLATHCQGQLQRPATRIQRQRQLFRAAPRAPAAQYSMVALPASLSAQAVLAGHEDHRRRLNRAKCARNRGPRP